MSAPKSSEALLSDLVLPLLQLELERLYDRAQRTTRGLDGNDVAKAVKYARAAISLRDSDTRAKPPHAPGDLERMSSDELYTLAAELLRAQGLDPEQLKAIRRGKAS